MQVCTQLSGSSNNMSSTITQLLGSFRKGTLEDSCSAGFAEAQLAWWFAQKQKTAAAQLRCQAQLQCARSDYVYIAAWQLLHIKLHHPRITRKVIFSEGARAASYHCAFKSSDINQLIESMCTKPAVRSFREAHFMNQGNSVYTYNNARTARIF
jgi:hypothetical protein